MTFHSFLISYHKCNNAFHALFLPEIIFFYSLIETMSVLCREDGQMKRKARAKEVLEKKEKKVLTFWPLNSKFRKIFCTFVRVNRKHFRLKRIDSSRKNTFYSHSLFCQQSNINILHQYTDKFIQEKSFLLKINLWMRAN